MQRILSMVVLSLVLAIAALALEFPKIDRQPAAADWQWGKPAALGHYDPNSTKPFQVDLRSRDLIGLDLTGRLEDLLHADFDDHTKWPAQMPQGYDYKQIMELGKNPGLGIRELHKQGITGRGVGIAICDQPLIVDHREYGDRLRLYEEINIRPGTVSQMHGPAVASIAVGETVGVAPEADLYYIAEFNGDFNDGGFTWNFEYLARGVQRILEINEQLPAEQKIRVLSISVGWDPSQKGYQQITVAVDKAKAAGMLVICSSVEGVHGFAFHGLGRSALANPDDVNSYEPGSWWASAFYRGESFAKQSNRLLVPMDARTTASPTGASEYVFYAQGGWSWSIPYIAGVYALAAQVEPKITPERFWALALRTGRTIDLHRGGEERRFGPILDAAGLVAALRRGELADQEAVAAELAKYPGVGSAQTRSAAQGQDKVTEALHQAVSDGDLERVRALLSAGAKVNEKGKEGRTALHLAVKGGHKDVVELLIAKGADVNAKDQDETTPLHTAASAGHKEIVQLLLSGGADANVLQGEIRWTPLHGACVYGHTEVAELLIQKGAKVDAKANDAKGKEYTPLNCALANEHYQTARVLVAHGADVTFTSPGDRPPLYYALLGSDKDLVETMISRGSRAPALHLAAFRGDRANVQGLCAAGTAVDARDEAQWTPLHWAISGGRRDIAEFLISQGAAVNAKGLFDEMPLHIAANAAAGSREAVELLLSHGAGVNAVTSRGNSPLHYAARRSVPIMEVLLARGANIDLKNRDGKTPLYLSVEKGNKETSELLIAKGADINARENYNRTPLHEACRTGQKDLAELLLAKGVDIEARDKFNWTPLHRACAAGQKDVVELLLAKGADVNAKSGEGPTPMSLAENGGHRQIVDLLRRHGAKE
jgi:ankyrin repeat protein